MFKEILVNFGFSNEYMCNNMRIIGKFSFGIPQGNFVMVNEKYRYEGPYIENNEIKEGILIHEKFIYRGNVMRYYDVLYRQREGITTYLNGDQEIGNYNFDNIDSVHKLIKINGDVFEGLFGLYNTLIEGKITFLNGDIIKVNYTEYIFRKNNGDVFDGYIDENYRYRFGKLIKKNGDIYKGHWIYENDNSFFTGHLTSEKFKGELYNNNYENGILKENGFLFEGKWRGQTFRGTIIYPNGDVYNGEYSNGKKNGYGILNTHNITYECNWINDMKNGKGKIIENETSKYLLWINDVESKKEIEKNIICPLCREELYFLLSKCKARESNINPNNICGICMDNICNVTLPCQDMFCYECIDIL